MKKILPIFLLLVVLPCHASRNRGTWFWASSSSTYGSANVVGSSIKEVETLNFFKRRGIKRVYGSYQGRPVSETDVIAAWNAKLDAAGIESQFLMSENSWIFPEKQASFLDKITDRVITFNAEQPAENQFDGLHLDIEPQALSDWSSISNTQRREYLQLLNNTYALVRAHFATNGLPDFPIYADIPVWFDNSSSIGWADFADRDAWFAAISTHLTGISLMPFERDSFNNINNSVSWERANITNATVRVGLESDIGAGNTWPTSIDFDTVMQTMDSYYNDDATDIQAYATWREVLDDEAIGNVNIAIYPALETKQIDLQFNTEINTTYSLLHSNDLSEWQEIDRFIGAETTATNLTISTSQTQGFWKIYHLIPIE